MAIIFRHILEELLGSKVQIAVLKALSLFWKGMTGRRIAREAGVSVRAAQLALQKFVDLGLVTHRAMGNSYLYQLNRDHVLVQEGILPLISLERDLQDRILQQVWEAASPDVVSLWLFGSVARGEETARSDLDVCIIVRQAATKKHVLQRLSEKAVALSRTHSVAVSPVIFSLGEFRKLWQTHDSFVRELGRTGQIWKGPALAELMAGKRLERKR